MTDGRSTRRRRRAGLDKQGVLVVAADVIAERGYSATRLSDVARRSNLAVSSLQYMFGSRDDLLVAAITTHSSLELAAIQEEAAKIADPRLRLETIVAAAISDESGTSGWLMWLEFWQTAARDHDLRDHAENMQQGWHQLLADAIGDGCDAGQFSADIDIADTAVAILAIIDGLALAFIIARSVPLHAEARRVALKTVDRLLS